MQAPDVLKSLCSDVAHAKIGWPAAVLDDLQWSCGSEKHAAFSSRSNEDWAAAVGDNGKQFTVNIKKYSEFKFANITARRRGPIALPSSLLPFLFADRMSAPL